MIIVGDHLVKLGVYCMPGDVIVYMNSPILHQLYIKGFFLVRVRVPCKTVEESE